MSRNPYLNASGHRSRRRRGRRSRRYNFLPVIIAVIGLILVLGLGFFAVKSIKKALSNRPTKEAVQVSEEETAETIEETLAPEPDSMEVVLAQADRLAAMYDYDAAIELLNGSEYAESEEAKAAIASYEETKNSCVRQNLSEITHVFFHILIYDITNVFDGDNREAGYNQVMTTKEEFFKILDEMYKRGYVLVKLHDIAHEEIGEDGKPHMVKGDIMLPEGKKAFVMSQDDVCYYEYMVEDYEGFATKMIIGEDGRPTTEMTHQDGSVTVGSYDLVPMLNDFIDEHPDFSYRGAKAVIAFTGYNGILGYRTSESSYNTEEYKAAHPGFDIESERAQATAVCDALKADGWELASHSWGHRNMGEISMEKFITDTDKWENEVEPLTGPCDIILFPFGSDIGDWHPYDTDGERYRYLHNAGFRYFCNVDSNQYFVQIGDDYVRQGRRNLDGYRMYYDLPENNPSKDHLSDLFDPTDVFDRRRPTPVPPMS